MQQGGPTRNCPFVPSAFLTLLEVRLYLSPKPRFRWCIIEVGKPAEKFRTFHV